MGKEGRAAWWSSTGAFEPVKRSSLSEPGSDIVGASFPQTCSRVPFDRSTGITSLRTSFQDIPRRSALFLEGDRHLRALHLRNRPPVLGPDEDPCTQ